MSRTGIAELKAELETLKARIAAGELAVEPLLPCPFCGNTNIKVHEKRRGNYRREGDNYQAWCSKCRARGPLVQDRPTAASITWNTRTGAAK